MAALLLRRLAAVCVVSTSSPTATRRNVMYVVVGARLPPQPWASRSTAHCSGAALLTPLAPPSPLLHRRSAGRGRLHLAEPGAGDPQPRQAGSAGHRLHAMLRAAGQLTMKIVPDFSQIRPPRFFCLQFLGLFLTESLCFSRPSAHLPAILSSRDEGRTPLACALPIASRRH